MTSETGWNYYDYESYDTAAGQVGRTQPRRSKLPMVPRREI